MKPILSILIILCLFTSLCYAQKTDSIKCKVTQQVALNSTQLFRQFFNLSLNSTVINNPYLLSYSIFFNKWGIRASLGYASNDSTDNQSDGSVFKSHVSNANFRIGPTVKVKLGKRFTVQPGLDILVSSSKVTTDNNFSSGSQQTSTSTSGWGFGPSCSILFNVTRHFSIGTEASFYYNSLKTTDSFTGSFNPGISTTSTGSSFAMTMPAAIFLFLNF